MTDLSRTQKQRLLNIIREDEGYNDITELLEDAVTDSVCLAICPHCNSIEEMEPDQDHGYCEECQDNYMISCLVLAEVI